MKRLMICLSLCAALSALLAQSSTGQTPLTSVRVNGVKLVYVDQGKGIPVVFVHGGLEDYRSWQPQVDAFSKSYRVITYSRRYNYPNNGNAPDASYSASVDADDLAALIKALKLPPAHVVGLSYGAYVALFLAAKHRELVRSLVLSEPPLMRLLPEIEGGKPLFTDLMTKLWEPATRGFQVGDEAGVTAALNGFGELGYSGTDQKMTYASLPNEVKQRLLENAPEWRALTMSKDAFPVLSRDAIKRIKTPTLLLSGQNTLALSKMIDPLLQRLLPHGERIILPNATHEMWNEYPAECRNAALKFLGRH